jgi:hypothetical protein
MSQTIFIELLTRSGDVLHRYRFEKLPVRIGRAYDNDLILDDPHVAPHHAELHQVHGELVLRAVETRNGLVVGKQRKNLVDMDGHNPVRLGHTRLRVRPIDFPVAPEIPDSTNHGWEGLLPAIIGLIIASFTALASQWLANTTATELLSMVPEAATLLAVVLGWTLFWALTNRIFAGSARFGRHLFIASLGFLLDELWGQAFGPIAYRFDWNALDRYSDIFYFVPLAITVHFHLVTIRPRQIKRTAIITSAMTLIVTAMLLTNNYVSRGTFANKSYMDAPYPPALQKSAAISLDEFLSRAEALRPTLEELREKAEE